ncbi:2321_t:CDS:2 [Acaulospora morrowiae]|uniref:2321_t:CDS:1 n=1 Tax=Acaulospora morrowiae TaxID=94023 RepID=A0A9N9F4V2_9GLOM|nr:2321_t:CDS:2 [Acaulospora morrowiae]
MSIAQKNKYDINQDLPDNDDSASYNQSKEELQNIFSYGLSSTKRDSSVWQYFDKTTVDNPGLPVCKKCKKVFSSLLNPNPHLKIEQQERDNLVVRWIVCDMQLFSVIESEEWRNMISKFDPRYQFSSRNTIKDHVIKLFQNKKDEVKTTLRQIPGKDIPQ